VVHQVDNHRIVRKCFRAGAAVLVGRHLVKSVQQRAADEISKPVVGEDAEEWNDLVDVRLDFLPRIRFGNVVFPGVRFHCARNDFILHQHGADARTGGELETVDAASPFLQRAERTSIDPVSEKGHLSRATFGMTAEHADSQILRMDYW